MQRRADDGLARVRQPGAHRGNGDPVGRAFEVVGVSQDPAAFPASDDHVLLLRSTSDGLDMLIAGSPVPLQVSREKPEVALCAWREQRLRSWKRGTLAEKLLDFFDDLTNARTKQGICDVVKRHAQRSVGGGYADIVIPADEGITLEGGGRARSGLDLPGLALVADIPDFGSPWREALYEQAVEFGAELVAHVPFGARGVMFLCERRSERIFDAYDWRLLLTLSEQGSRAVERIEMLEAARQLSLTDPLTGLANRRQLDIVMRHAWAAAERGGSLAVLLIDLDNFKQVNDRHGHNLGDQVLRVVAETIERETRGADLAVRYGGDEFLVVLPGGTREGARQLARRVEQRLKGWVEVSTGAAEYHSSYLVPKELIGAADQDLYREKEQRRQAGSSGGQQTLPNQPGLPTWA